MTERMTDRAFALIHRAASTRRGVQGKAFRMHPDTLKTITRERGLTVAPPALYGVHVNTDPFMAYGVIELEENAVFEERERWRNRRQQ